MLSNSVMDCLNLITFDDFKVLNRIPRVMKVPGFISEFEDTPSAGAGAGDCIAIPPISVERRIIVSNQLPIRSFRDSSTNKFVFELDNDSLYLQLKDGFPANTEVYYVGTLKADIETKDQEDVSQFLFDKFRCLPVFLNVELHNKFYHGFCKHYLWPLFHYMLPLSPIHSARFDRSQWQAYVMANKLFADKVVEVLNPDEDSVWIHDYHLMVLPTFLRKRYHRVKLGFFLHSPFPSSEIYRTIPVREEILKGFLNCDLIGFHTFDYARHFLSCCSRMLGLNYESKRGYLGLDYFGRTVSIKILPAGIHMGQLETLLNMDSTAKLVRELKEKYEGKIVMVGVDDLDIFKGLSLKFLAMWKLLEEHESLRGKLVLVQIANPARSEGRDVQEVLSENNHIIEKINELYSQPGYEPIVLINGPVSTQEKAAYYAISECCVVNAIRDGMNLVSYKYTVCRQGSSVLDEVLELDEKHARKSVLIVSEFVGCSPSLSGAIRVNPWDVDDVANAIYRGITMADAEKQLRHEKHFKYISSHNIAYWARSFDQDLVRACREHYLKRYWGVGLGLGFRIVALGPNFRKLAMDPIVNAYNSTNSRLILLDYDGTMMPQICIDQAPSNEVISVLNRLCSDPKNVVFIVSGRGKDPLSKWFSPCERLGISAEHGFFTRWTRDSEWETSSMVMDSEWKKIAEPVMNLYTETTDGSYIEHKESALVWHHGEADAHFGSSQAKELLDHLENVLANEPVVVKRGQHIVEVKPQGVSKGIVVQNLLSKMRSRNKSPDFLLCIGDDRSDEDMFESIANQAEDPSVPAIAQVFACTVGQKPSMAKYYLDDTSEVIKLLQSIATASSMSKYELKE
ncbi:Alpha alpha-trehalose-phosphate synthase [UDP-forming] 6 [Euphorbia peplus]|nr:Alpha alpha-trehalose-phosphate synthase [UDP-forming] 6 [Euphorbia peplus]